MSKLVLFGDSWCQGVWSLHGKNELVNSHPGMVEQLSKKNYNVINLARGGSNLWQILYSVFVYLRTPQLSTENLKFIVFQTDAVREQQSDKFSINYQTLFHESSDVKDFYVRAAEIFYIKLNEIANQFDVKIYLCGGLSDLSIELLTKINNFSNLIVMNESWVKLLYPGHEPSLIPLRIDPNLLQSAIKFQREDLCSDIVSISDSNFIKLQSVLETEYFGEVIGDYHPNLKGHNVMAEYIDNFLTKENNA
jgi:hypothetical protein